MGCPSPRTIPRLWETTPAGPMVTRAADVRWLREELAGRDCELIQRASGQCTELYTRLPWPGISHAVHGWNRLWFAMGRGAALATGNEAAGDKVAGR